MKQKILVTTAAVALSGALTLGSLPQAVAAVPVGSVRKVTAVGDSYPAGVGGNEGNAYVERYGRRTKQPARNRAHGGWTTNDVLYQFAHEPAVVRELRDSRTVIITIGANDIAQTFPNPSRVATDMRPYRPALATFNKNMGRVLGEVSKSRGGKNSRVVVTTYNNIYADGGALNRQGKNFAKGAENLTKQVNAIIMAQCKAHRMTCLDIYGYFDIAAVNSLVTPDGTHPSSKGHQLYANQIYRRVR